MKITIIIADWEELTDSDGEAAAIPTTASTAAATVATRNSTGVAASVAAFRAIAKNNKPGLWWLMRGRYRS